MKWRKSNVNSKWYKPIRYLKKKKPKTNGNGFRIQPRFQRAIGNSSICINNLHPSRRLHIFTFNAPSSHATLNLSSRLCPMRGKGGWSSDSLNSPPVLRAFYLHFTLSLKISNIGEKISETLDSFSIDANREKSPISES